MNLKLQAISDKLGAIFACCLLLVACNIAIAQPTPTLQQLNQAARQNRQLQQQQKQRIQALNQDLANLDAATQGQLDQLRALQTETARLERERADLSVQINLLDTQRKEAEAKINDLQSQLDGLKDRLSTMLRSLQREKAGRYLPLLRAQSFTDLAVRSRWVSTLGEHQTDLMDRITATVRTLSDEKLRLQLLVDDLSRTRAERETRIQALNQNQKTVNITVSNLRGQRAGRAVLLRESLVAQEQLRNQLRGIQGQIGTEIKRIAEERAKREAELKRQRELARQREIARQKEAARVAQIKVANERKRRQAELEAQRRKDQEAQQQAQDAVKEVPEIPAQLSGPLSFPVQGGRISSRYGADGADYQILQGPSPSSTIVSAADGIVAQNVYVANLGYTIVVIHSNQISTVYVNVLDPRVAAGERVSRGQIIGFTGGGALIPNDQMWFQVGMTDANGNPVYVDPSRFY